MRIPQKLFNPALVKNECMKEKNHKLGKSFYVWRNHMFRHGFIYKYMNVSKLIKEDLKLTLEEVKRF